MNNIIEEIFDVVDQSTTNDKHLKLSHSKVNGVKGDSYKDLYEKINKWVSNPKSNPLEFKIVNKTGLYIRLNRSHFTINNNQAIITSIKAFSFYHRRRKKGEKHATMIFICHLTNDYESRLDLALKSYEVDKKLAKHNYCEISNSYIQIPTLEAFLPTYHSICYLSNPKTAKNKINLIKNHFPDLLQIPVNLIKGAELLRFIQKYEIKSTEPCFTYDKTAKRYKVSDSTLKHYICTLRAALESASTFSDHPFDLCGSLNKDIKFQINNDSDRYLTEPEILHVLESLADRDKTKINKIKKVEPQKCQFYDYLTPFMLLSLSTGLRPKYALALKWHHIDFKRKQIVILGDNGKIKENEWCDMTDELVMIMKHWKLHSIHSNSKASWVFPSPKNNGYPLTTYKTTFTTFRNNYKIDNFVMYDLRHTFATIFTETFQDIFATQHALHHKDAKSTKRYARMLNSTRAKGIKTFEQNKQSFISHYELS